MIVIQVFFFGNLLNIYMIFHNSVFLTDNVICDSIFPGEGVYLALCSLNSHCLFLYLKGNFFVSIIYRIEGRKLV